MDRTLVCRHCKQRLYDLNFNTLKVCLSERDVSKEFKLLEIDKYLETYLRTDPNFIYLREKNRTNFSIDAVD